jgi:Rhamnan synthesis protein F
MFAKKSVQMPYNDSANNLAGQPALSGRPIAQLLTKGLWALRRNERRVASSGLFDELWYVANNPDAARFPGGALRHYIRVGARALRDPNPYFDAAQYTARHPEARANPIVHYLRRGATEGFRPSPAFDPVWYRATYADVAAAGVEPLSHFLRVGKGEGRLPKEPHDFRPVDAAELVCLKRSASPETMALFVTYAPAGHIKPHVPPYLAALARERVSTTLIVNADHPAAVPHADVIDLVDGLYLRQNQGFDFAAWSHVARGIDFSRTRSLYLINDSVVGPLNAERFSEVMDRIRASSAHLVGLTESLQIERHFQSYFLVAKAEGVAALVSFLLGVKAYRDKHAVIISYEVPLLRHFLRTGLRGEALLPPSMRGNASIEEWRELLERGLPFVKVSALRSESGDWREVLRVQGYDPRIVEGTLSLLEQT